MGAVLAISFTPSEGGTEYVRAPQPDASIWDEAIKIAKTVDRSIMYNDDDNIRYAIVDALQRTKARRLASQPEVKEKNK